MTLRINGTGTAFKIDNQTIHESAWLNFTVRVDKSSHGRARLMVTSGELKIGGQTYTAVKGQGIINFHSGKLILHVHLKDSHGNSIRLILHGRVSNLPKSLSIGSGFNVDIKKPESKVADKWFLEFPGAKITRVA